MSRLVGRLDRLARRTAMWVGQRVIGWAQRVPVARRGHPDQLAKWDPSQGPPPNWIALVQDRAPELLELQERAPEPQPTWPPLPDGLAFEREADRGSTGTADTSESTGNRRVVQRRDRGPVARRRRKDRIEPEPVVDEHVLSPRPPQPDGPEGRRVPRTRMPRFSSADVLAAEASGAEATDAVSERVSATPRPDPPNGPARATADRSTEVPLPPQPGQWVNTPTVRMRPSTENLFDFEDVSMPDKLRSTQTQPRSTQISAATEAAPLCPPPPKEPATSVFERLWGRFQPTDRPLKGPSQQPTPASKPSATRHARFSSVGAYDSAGHLGTRDYSGQVAMAVGSRVTTRPVMQRSLTVGLEAARADKASVNHNATNSRWASLPEPVGAVQIRGSFAERRRTEGERM